MAFDIRQLRYAIAAADRGSFRRAARPLDVEQSTLSPPIHHHDGTQIIAK
jgi:DNA-binding transcriptional LysR family regulator